jgi:hypothetical protein
MRTRFVSLLAVIAVQFGLSADIPKIKPGDKVQMTRSEDLNFNDKFSRRANRGDLFEVLAYRGDLKKLFVAAKDSNGKAIALSIPEDAVEILSDDAAKRADAKATLARARQVSVAAFAEVARLKKNAERIPIVAAVSGGIVVDRDTNAPRREAEHASANQLEADAKADLKKAEVAYEDAIAALDGKLRRRDKAKAPLSDLAIDSLPGLPGIASLKPIDTLESAPKNAGPRFVIPPREGRTEIIQGRRFSQAKILSIDKDSISVKHSGGVTKLHPGVVPKVLIDDFQAEVSLCKFGKLGSVSSYLALHPGLAEDEGRNGDVTLSVTERDLQLRIRLKDNVPVQVVYAFSPPRTAQAFDELLGRYSRGQMWTEVAPLLNVYREFESADKKVSARILFPHSFSVVDDELNGAR